MDNQDENFGGDGVSCSDSVVQTSMNHKNDIAGTGAWWLERPPGGSTGKHQMGTAVGKPLKGKGDNSFP
jgi:hypothetical protein